MAIGSECHLPSVATAPPRPCITNVCASERGGGEERSERERMCVHVHLCTVLLRVQHVYPNTKEEAEAEIKDSLECTAGSRPVRQQRPWNLPQEPSHGGHI